MEKARRKGVLGKAFLRAPPYPPCLRVESGRQHLQERLDPRLRPHVQRAGAVALERQDRQPQLAAHERVLRPAGNRSSARSGSRPRTRRSAICSRMSARRRRYRTDTCSASTARRASASGCGMANWRGISLKTTRAPRDSSSSKNPSQIGGTPRSAEANGAFVRPVAPRTRRSARTRARRSAPGRRRNRCTRSSRDAAPRRWRGSRASSVRPSDAPERARCPAAASSPPPPAASRRAPRRTGRAPGPAAPNRRANTGTRTGRSPPPSARSISDERVRVRAVALDAPRRSASAPAGAPWRRSPCSTSRNFAGSRSARPPRRVAARCRR